MHAVAGIGNPAGGTVGLISMTLLDVHDLTVTYKAQGSLRSWRRQQRPAAVRGVSFRIAAGETFALVGESGSGKSTIARAVAGLVPIDAGTLRFDGEDISRPVAGRSVGVRREIQIVFQNPDASLNRRHAVAYIIGRPLQVYFGVGRTERQRRVAGLLEDVRLDAGYLRRLPRQLSGGERQRVAIARALAAEPRLLLCDEILSALDVSVQASILDLLLGLQREHNIACLFISHDLAVVRWLAHRVGVLYQGALCELGPVSAVFSPPVHPYTETLLQAVPRIGAGRAGGTGVAVEPTPEASARGCPFAPRCSRRLGPLCDDAPPPWHEASPGHRIRCHIPPSALADAQRATRSQP